MPFFFRVRYTSKVILIVLEFLKVNKIIMFSDYTCAFQFGFDALFTLYLVLSSAGNLVIQLSLFYNVCVYQTSV